MKINKIERKLLIIIYKNNLLEKNSLTNIQKQTDLDKINIINNLHNLKTLKLIKESLSSILISTLIIFSSRDVPPLPGQTYTLSTLLDFESFHAIACSLPP